jgi:hypothetical protein
MAKKLTLARGLDPLERTIGPERSAELPKVCKVDHHQRPLPQLANM